MLLKLPQRTRAMLLLFSLCSVSTVHAAPVNYSIDFLATFAGNAASGTFTYDSSSGLFTDFLVDWEGASLDLTNAANDPLIGNGGPLCLGGAVGGAATFEAIAGACGAADKPFWSANTFFGPYDFAFKISDDAAGSFLSVRVLGPSTQEILSAGGVWAVTANPTPNVPEPEPLLLTLSSLLGLAFLMRTRARG